MRRSRRSLGSTSNTEDGWCLENGKFSTLQFEEMNICNMANQRKENPVLRLASVLVVIFSQLTKLRRKSLEWSVRGFLSGANRKSPVAWTVG